MTLATRTGWPDGIRTRLGRLWRTNGLATTPWTRLGAVLLAVLAAAVAFTVVGTILFYQAPAVVGRLGRWLPLFMKVPTWIYLVAVPAVVFSLYFPTLGARSSFFFMGWASLVGLTAELIGTQTGYPFGSYSYTEFLGPKILGHVPFLIPLSWYAMATLSFDLAQRLEMNRAQRILAGAVFMVLWDLALDPAMAYGFPVWEWGTSGFFYGMPALNLAGWFVTSLVIMWGLEILGGGLPGGRPPLVRTVWIVSAAMPLGISLAREMWAAVVVGSIAVAIPLLALATRQPIRRQWARRA